MPPIYNETETRAKLIDPSLRARGWTEAHIKREENAGGLYKVRGKWRREQKKADYLLRIPVEGQKVAVAVALIEAKKNTFPPLHGLEQAKLYASADRLNVPFVYSSNGYLFVEFDRTTGITSSPQPMDRFPKPEELQARYEAHMGFKLTTPAAQPLLTSYTGGDAVRRYFTKGQPTEKIWYYDLSQLKIRNRIPLTIKHFAPFFKMLPTLAISEHSWTVDLEERKSKAAEEATPIYKQAKDKQRETIPLEARLKELKAQKQTASEEYQSLQTQVKTLQKESRDLRARAQAIEDAVYDLKAVNPNAVVVEDKRTPAEL